MPSPTQLWRLAPDGWPIERIDPATGIRFPVFSGAAEEQPVAWDWPADPAWATSRDWIE